MPHQVSVELVVFSYVLKVGMSDATRARERLNDAERNLNSVQKQLEIAKEDLRNLFDPAWYGAEGEWKKLHGTCLTKDTGEYVSLD